MEEEGDILILDTVGGINGTTTRIELYLFEYTNHKHRLLGYQYKSEVRLYPIVKVVKKVWIQGRDLPIPLVINNATFLMIQMKHNHWLSLLWLWNAVDMTIRNLGGDGSLYIDE